MYEKKKASIFLINIHCTHLNGGATGHYRRACSHSSHGCRVITKGSQLVSNYSSPAWRIGLGSDCIGPILSCRCLRDIAATAPDQCQMAGNTTAN